MSSPARPLRTTPAVSRPGLTAETWPAGGCQGSHHHVPAKGTCPRRPSPSYRTRAGLQLRRTVSCGAMPQASAKYPTGQFASDHGSSPEIYLGVATVRRQGSNSQGTRSEGQSVQKSMPFCGHVSKHANVRIASAILGRVDKIIAADLTAYRHRIQAGIHTSSWRTLIVV